MERLTDYLYSELIGAGFDLIPPKIRNRLQYTHFFTGTDPVYAGLFDYTDTDDGRSYRDCWCVAEPFHLKVQSPTTIIMPYNNPNYPLMLRPAMVVHELGHVLDELLGFDYLATPVTRYGATNRFEAFAEAFTYWLFPAFGEYYDIMNPIDEQTLNLFEQLEV